MLLECVDRETACALLPKGSRDAGIVDEAGFEVGQLLAGGNRFGCETIEVVAVNDVAADGAELEDEAVEKRALGMLLAFRLDESPVGEDRAPAGSIAGRVAGEVGGFVGESKGQHVAEDALEGDGDAAVGSVGGVAGSGGGGFLWLEEGIGNVLEVAAKCEVFLVVGSQGGALFLACCGGRGGG